MRVEKENIATVIKTVDITCDVCNQSCRDKFDMNYELVSLKGSWGYGSNMDGISWECEICEQCASKVKQFIESLGGKVIETNYI